MMRYLVAYIAAGIAFLAIDSIWLMTMADLLYRPLLGDLLTESFNLAPAVLFYVIYIGGIVIFAVRPALATGRWTTAALFGALFGFCAYATYDLTNQATIRNWPALITVADLCWGTVLTAVAATTGFAASTRVVR
jgi:uncharacterized membrane protein